MFNFILHDQRKGPIWNVIMWTSLFLGQGVIICLYSQEWYAQRYCPLKEVTCTVYVYLHLSCKCRIWAQYDNHYDNNFSSAIFSWVGDTSLLELPERPVVGHREAVIFARITSRCVNAFLLAKSSCPPHLFYLIVMKLELMKYDLLWHQS